MAAASTHAAGPTILLKGSGSDLAHEHALFPPGWQRREGCAADSFHISTAVTGSK